MCGTHVYLDQDLFGRIDLWANNVICQGDSGGYIRRNNGPGGSSSALGLVSQRSPAPAGSVCTETSGETTGVVIFSRMARINEWGVEKFGVSMKAWGS